eukprot:CAMPEP_0115700398 /NCGR_PEP_ID=MMETSP0272-20121206/67395_1 /TAXON_ID=71861 /ORGANISM="Scrippsiella trochoidea, Strain CCMP3099" /LENGTH=76 /DNA_ID=CAMNT_0003140895 /DNA_START=172 /DNA_END=400 /DNA_ORIENTATION=+
MPASFGKLTLVAAHTSDPSSRRGLEGSRRVSGAGAALIAALPPPELDAATSSSSSSEKRKASWASARIAATMMLVA